MATITKNNNKNGVSFRIQVYVKNRGTGKGETKVTTWKPPIDLTGKQAEREALKFALGFEDQIKKESELEVVVNGDIKFKDFAKSWLERVRINNSPSYYASMKYVLGNINSQMGEFKLKELTPPVIQKYVDSLSKIQLVKTNAKAKEALAFVFKDNKISLCDLSKRTGLGKETISAALHGKSITAESAETISKGLMSEVKNLFELNKTREFLAQATKAKYCRTLRAILSVAKKQMVIPENYAANGFVKLISEPRSEIHCMDDIQSKQFVEALKHEHDIRKKTILITLILTGLRRGEICGLEWEDVDFDNSEISVKRSTTAVSGLGVITGKPKTKTSVRTITIPDMLIDLLKDYKIFWDKCIEQIGDRYTGTRRLFIREDGIPIYPSTVMYWLKKVLESAGMPHFTVHSLRHTNITLQLIAGVPMKTVSARAGHASSKVTNETYSHFIKSSDRDAAQRLNMIFGQ